MSIFRFKKRKKEEGKWFCVKKQTLIPFRTEAEGRATNMYKKIEEEDTKGTLKN